MTLTQLKRYGLQKDSKEYKPTPPDFDIEELVKRIAFGGNRGR